MWPNVDYWNRDIFDPQPEVGWDDVDFRRYLPSDAHILRLAEDMSGAHTGQQDETKRWPSDFRALGLYGERAFARVFDLTMDTAIRRYGSGRKNAVLSDGTTVDVMTRRLLRNRQVPDLTRRVKGYRKLADVACLVLWVGSGWEPVFLGWVPDEEIKERGTVRAYQDGNPNYVLPSSALRPMWALMAMHNPDSPLAQMDSIKKPMAERVVADPAQLSFDQLIA
jgi:hypothetical protein